MLKLILILSLLIVILILVDVMLFRAIAKKDKQIKSLEDTLSRQKKLIKEIDEIKEKADEQKKSFSTGDYNERLNASLNVLRDIKAKRSSGNTKY